MGFFFFFVFSVSTYRYVAYGQYTYWIHKKLGRKISIAILSFVVKKKKNRESFPSESGSYRGFEYAHLKPDNNEYDIVDYQLQIITIHMM